MNLRCLAAATAVAALAAGAAGAQQVTLETAYIASGDYVTLTGSLPDHTSLNGAVKPAGTIQFTGVNAEGNAFTLNSYCVDLEDPVTVPPVGSQSNPAQLYDSNGDPGIVFNIKPITADATPNVTQTAAQIADVAFLVQFGAYIDGTNSVGMPPAANIWTNYDQEIWGNEAPATFGSVSIATSLDLWSFYADGQVPSGATENYNSDGTNFYGVGGDIAAMDTAVQVLIWETLFPDVTASFSSTDPSQGNTYGCGDQTCTGYSEEEVYASELSKILQALALTGTGAGLPQLQQTSVQTVGIANIVEGELTPEPGAWTMMVTGVFGVGAMLRRKRRALAFAA